MRTWHFVCASQTGPRKRNEDFVVVGSHKVARRRYFYLSACDGVGSLPGSGTCANAVGTAAVKLALRYIERRGTRRTFSDRDAQLFAETLYRVSDEVQGNPSQGTTLVQAVFSDESGIVAWAGDSRAYALDVDGMLLQITQDHHDEEGRLTSFYTGGGRLRGTLGHSFFGMKDILAVCITTDGVHETCTCAQLRHFLLYCMSKTIKDNLRFDAELRSFLDRGASDNFSMALAYRHAAPRRLLTLYKRPAMVPSIMV